jgi:hypothetical protein
MDGETDGAERGLRGLPALIVDFGRLLNEIYKTHRPKIVVANRTFPIEVGRFSMLIPSSAFNVSAGEWTLLIQALREVEIEVPLARRLSE